MLRRRKVLAVQFTSHWFSEYLCCGVLRKFSLRGLKMVLRSRNTVSAPSRRMLSTSTSCRILPLGDTPMICHSALGTVTGAGSGLAVPGRTGLVLPGRGWVAQAASSRLAAARKINRISRLLSKDMGKSRTLCR
ncbi:hypothetical protein D3C72_1996650 [compost metagenome]